MKIAFITDIHIAADSEHPADVDVRANFLRALDYVQATKPDCVVLGGDLCFDVGDRAIYRWIRAQLQNLPCQWFAIPGNHDDVTMMADELHLNHHLTNGELYSASALEGHPALFLDSSKGAFSDTQWQWLEDQLALISQQVLVFCHHPVLPADALFMDTKYPFRQQAQWVETTEDLPCRIQMFSGHYHTEATTLRGNTSILITPSTYIQLDPHTPDLVLVKTPPALREITVSIYGLTSRVVSLS